MKVAMLCSLYPPYNVGGTEKAVALLAESLSAQGVDVFVISLHEGTVERIEQRNGVRIYRVPVDNLYMPVPTETRPGALRRLIWHLREMWNSKAASRVAAILASERPDVFHTHSLSGFSVAVWHAAKKLGIPRVHTLHDYYALCSRSTLYKNNRICTSRCLDCRLFTANRRSAADAVNAVAGVSGDILERHRAQGYFLCAQQQVVYNIQPVLKESPAPVTEALTFGFIGRVTPDKGIEVLLEAFSTMPEAPCRLRIAGRGLPAYIEDLQRRYPDNRIEWLGFTPAAEFFPSVDVVVIPSVWPEPLGYTCIESLFAGKSVIASTIGGLREVAVLAPLHRLTAPGDAPSLASALKEAMSDPLRWKTHRMPPPQSLQAFSEHHVSEQYLKMYASALGSNPGSDLGSDLGSEESAPSSTHQTLK